MFEGLDSIDWANIEHIYGQSETIPQRIRGLLSDDFFVRAEAVVFLFGEPYSMYPSVGDIYASTALIIPFVLEIIALNPAQDDVSLLRAISSVAVNIHEINLVPDPRSTHRPPKWSIAQLRAKLAVYDALARGIPLFLGFLSHVDQEVRACVVFILKDLTDHAPQILPQLYQRFPHETDLQVQMDMLYGIAELVTHASARHETLLRPEALTFLEQIAANHPIAKLRAVAACAYALIGEPPPDYLPKPGIQSPVIIHALSQWYDLVYQSRDVVFDQFPAHFLGWVLSRLTPQALIQLLQQSQHSAEEVHFLARILLASIFIDDDYRKEHLERFEAVHFPQDQRYYIANYINIPSNILRQEQKVLVRSIVENDKFWELPTNLFSFFYGLPDSREALRQLVEDGQSPARDSDPNG